MGFPSRPPCTEKTHLANLEQFWLESEGGILEKRRARDAHDAGFLVRDLSLSHAVGVLVQHKPGVSLLKELSLPPFPWAQVLCKVGLFRYRAITPYFYVLHLLQVSIYTYVAMQRVM